MTRAELLAEFREVVNDQAKPYAWSDTRALRILSLAQDQFCKDTGFFLDSSSYIITTEPGVRDYAIPERAIEVLIATLNGSELRKVKGLPPASDGPPIAWQTDLETGMISFSPTPDAVYTVPLRVWRKSKIAFRASGNPEIPEDLHLALIEWGAWCFYGDHDRELQDPVKAAEHKANYDKIWVPQGKREFARLCAGRATFAPNPLYLV